MTSFLFWDKLILGTVLDCITIVLDVCPVLLDVQETGKIAIFGFDGVGLM